RAGGEGAADAAEGGNERADHEQQRRGEREVDRDVFADTKCEQDRGGGTGVHDSATRCNRDHTRGGSEADHRERGQRREGETESGSIAIASIIPSDTIESTIASSPTRAPPSLRRTPTLTR